MTLSMLDRTRVVTRRIHQTQVMLSFSLKWYNAPVLRITGHPLIDSELSKVATKIKDGIARLMIRFGWLKNEAITTTVYEDSQVIDLGNICSAICESEANIYRLIHKDVKYIVCGPRQIAPIAQSPDAIKPYLTSFGIPPDFELPVVVWERSADNERPVKKVYPKLFLGMTVIVVPWMDGLLLLPELETPMQLKYQPSVHIKSCPRCGSYSTLTMVGNMLKCTCGWVGEI